MARPTFDGVCVTIACTDLLRTREFYEGVLGAEPLPGLDPNASVCAWYRLGRLVFSLMPNAAEATPATFPDHPMPILWLEVEDISEAEAFLRQRGVHILQPSDGSFMMVTDPDGLALEVWERNPDNPRPDQLT